MAPFPNHSPTSLSLGPLESEILGILWHLEAGTVREIHELILADPDRELAYPSVTTVLNRLAKKGWVQCDRQAQAFIWRPLISEHEAQVLQAQQHLKDFLKVSHPDIVATFIESLDEASLAQLDAISAQIKAAREAKQDP